MIRNEKLISCNVEGFEQRRKRSYADTDIYEHTFYASLIYCVKKSRPNCYPQSASTKLLRNQGSGTDTVNSYVLNDRKINYIDLKDIS